MQDIGVLESYQLHHSVTHMKRNLSKTIPKRDLDNICAIGAVNVQTSVVLVRIRRFSVSSRFLMTSSNMAGRAK